MIQVSIGHINVYKTLEAAANQGKCDATQPNKQKDFKRTNRSGFNGTRTNQDSQQAKVRTNALLCACPGENSNPPTLAEWSAMPIRTETLAILCLRNRSLVQLA